MEYMIRFMQCHETFRIAEIQALAVLEKIDLEILSYSLDVSTYTFRVQASLAHYISSHHSAS